jgi:translation initiation factor 3 subunit E
MAEHDLSKTIIPYLDRHLAFPLLAHLVETSLFPVEEVQVAQYELAKETNMVDYTVSLFQQTNPDKETPPGKYYSESRTIAIDYFVQSSMESGKMQCQRTNVFSKRLRLF